MSPPVDAVLLNAHLHFWVVAEYVSVCLVILGVVGEHTGEFSGIFGADGKAKRKRLTKYSSWLLIFGLVAELFCLFTTNQLSDEVIARLQNDTAKSYRAAASANKTAESERHERIKLEARVAPRSMDFAQRKLIAEALRPFAGQSVTVSSYGLDGEGATLAAQIIEVLTAAGILVKDDRALTIPSGGFELGVHIRGPETEFLSTLYTVFSSVGKLQTFVNGPTFRSGATLIGNAQLSGNGSMLGGGGIVNLAKPTAGPLTIAVGIKPVPVVR